MLTAIEYVGSDNGAVWSFKCDCGSVVERKSSIVSRGHIVSCGCLSKASRFSGKGICEGQKFGDVTAIRPAGRSGHNIKWELSCGCGAVFFSIASNILSGNTKSCGCLKKMASTERNRTHGMTDTKAYWQWKNMLRRCYEKKNPAYPGYGGRGITVSDEWLDFGVFYSDMGDAPVGMSLDRSDNNEGYSNNNCRWATKNEQARNTRSNVFLTIGSETKTIIEWAEIHGVPHSRIYQRRRAGWRDEELFLPIRPNRAAPKI